jgi:tetratricopeptide (TPR) repeat protein
MGKSSRKSKQKLVPESKQLSVGWMIAILVAVGFVVFLPTLHNQFIFDDRALVANNPLLRGAGGVKETLTSGRTLRMITFVFEHALWHMNPTGYHVTNIILHILTGLMLFVLLRKLSGRSSLAFAASLLFLCHPLTTEAVASIANRKESLHSLFSLVAIYAYLKADKQRWYYLVAFIAFIMALTSKEVAIAVPVLMIVVDWLFREKNLWLVIKKRGWFIGAILLPVVAAAAYRFRGMSVSNIISLDVYGDISYFNIVLTTLYRVPDYLRLAIFPTPLSADYYTQIVQSFFNIKVFVGLICVVGLVAGGVLLRKKQPFLALGMLWIFITWLPVSNLVPTAYFLAERYFYFPLIGVTLIAAVGWEDWRKRSSLSYFGIFFLVVVFGFMTVQRNQDWENEYRLWSSTLSHQPDNPKAHYYFANALREQGRYKDAESHFKRAVAIKPDFIWAWVNLANLYTLGRDYNSAIPTYRRVLELDPNQAVPHNNMGCAFYNMGNVDSARVHYQRAIELNSDYGEAWNNIGVALSEGGHPDSAIFYYYRAIQSAPTWPEPYQRIIQCLILTNRLDKAVTVLDRYLALPYIPDREARVEQRQKILAVIESRKAGKEKQAQVGSPQVSSKK